ncbi:MAG: hypothetical protein HZB12_03575 [Candidatus Yonathbacteria bacterium]|nr:hypothetical protein [Candidatus Yonathbacteria bacterium]
MFTTRNLLMLIGRHAAIALGAVAVAVIAVYFLAREIAHVSDGVVQNRHLVATLEKRTELFSTLARDAQIVGTNDTLVEHAFISSDNILEFISALESLALKNGAVESFHFETPVPAPISSPFPLSTIGYSNSLTLDIAGLVNYLKDFDTLPYFTKITSLAITSEGATGWRGASAVSLHATLYTKTIQ